MKNYPLSLRSKTVVTNKDQPESFILHPSKKIDPKDRIRMADAMKSLSWSRLVESSSEIYDRLVAKALSNTAAQSDRIG